MKLYQRGFDKLNGGALAHTGEAILMLCKFADETNADEGKFTVSWIPDNEDEKPAIGEWVPEVILRVHKYTGEED